VEAREVGDDLLVVVVADPGRVCEQVFDRHRFRDLREGYVEHVGDWGGECQRALLDQRADAECGERLRHARGSEPRLHRVDDLVAAVRVAVCPLEGEVRAEVK
jgi:hypothetical protein